jgi:hypothetical protein
LDIWKNGVNWVRDTGTYSYFNDDSEGLSYYSGTKGHSTVCFDGRDQMPRFGRFLFGCWLHPEKILWDPDAGIVKCGYVDFQGAEHIREVRRTEQGWIVVDKFDGFVDEAVIRWHLASADWIERDGSMSCEHLVIKVESEEPTTQTLTTLPQSRYYLLQQPAPVFEVKCRTKGTVTTRFTFTA